MCKLRSRASLLALLLTLLPTLLMAQEKAPKSTQPTAPLFGGIMVGVDLYDPFSHLLLGQASSSYTLRMEADIRHRIFPTWEIGVGSISETPDDMNFTYTGKPALFNRIGVNYNFSYKSNKPDFFYVGGRYGFSAFHYGVSNISYEDSYWEQNITTQIPNQHASAHWVELVGGVRVHLYQRLFMGWSISYKKMIWQNNPKNSEPMFIPGYGAATTPVGFLYTLSYQVW